MNENITPDTAAPVVDRSAAVAATWTNPAVKASRSVRNHVQVNGVEYRSVAAAFKELDLPMSRHVPLRQKLKAADTGKATFQVPGEKEGTVVDYLFTLVPSGPADAAE